VILASIIHVDHIAPGWIYSIYSISEASIVSVVEPKYLPIAGTGGWTIYNNN
jgi:hypothetical protein